jgi:hypothetical protein
VDDLLLQRFQHLRTFPIDVNQACLRRTG